MLHQNFISWLIILLVWANFVPLAQADTQKSVEPYLEAVKERITEFSLDNGLKFIVLENHDAPVISFVTYANVGGVNEVNGTTGVAHFLEHLAFKGTEKIGTSNYAAEKKLLDSLDVVFLEMKSASKNAPQGKLSQLELEFNRLDAEANKYVKQNEFGQIVEIEGGVGLNAATSTDSTVYYYSFPANKLELWMSLESERFLHPVFREFYQEKQVILEERRLRTDNSPTGKMFEAFLDTAFSEHPYKRPVIGYDVDIRNLERKDVANFFNTYYTANNLTIAIVGDVNPQQAKQLAKVYFGRYPRKPSPPALTKVEPKQTKTLEINLNLAAQPFYLEGYHCAGINDPDYAVYQILSGILSGGRTSRLYQSLVEQQQVALAAQGLIGYPGDKYANLMIFYALSAPGKNLDELASALRQQLELLKQQPVSMIELDRVKNQAKAGLLRLLNSNLGMAQQLAEYQAKTGDWRNLFEQLQALNAVDAADIQRVAQATFIPENRTVGRVTP